MFSLLLKQRGISPELEELRKKRIGITSLEAGMIALVLVIGGVATIVSVGTYFYVTQSNNAGKPIATSTTTATFIQPTTITAFMTVGGGPTVTTTATIGGLTVTTTATLTRTQTIISAGGLCGGQTITIGALNDLSGALSAQGKGDLAAEQIAIQEINTQLQASECRLTFALNNQDYALDNTKALSELQAMAAAGIQVVVGPLNSGAANAILSFANSNHIVLISPSSTSPVLHVSDTSNNYLFRTTPNDASQGQAIAREALTQGARAVVVINRDDTYGNGVANTTIGFLKQDGLAVSNIAGPFKYNAATTDFTSLVAQVTSAFNSLNIGANAGHVAIVCISFQEIGTLLQQASKQSPAVYNTVWYGSDGEAQNSLLSNSTVGPYTSHVRLPSTLYNAVNNSKTLAFFAKYNGTPQLSAIVSGGIPYTLEGYDDVWLAVLAIMTAGQNSGTAIHNIFPSVAANSYGLTGWEGLSGNDRIPASYQIWKVSQSGAQYTWVIAGTWDYTTDSVTWQNPP